MIKITAIVRMRETMAGFPPLPSRDSRTPVNKDGDAEDASGTVEVQGLSRKEDFILPNLFLGAHDYNPIALDIFSCQNLGAYYNSLT